MKLAIGENKGRGREGSGGGEEVGELLFLFTCMAPLVIFV